MGRFISAVLFVLSVILWTKSIGAIVLPTLLPTGIVKRGQKSFLRASAMGANKKKKCGGAWSGETEAEGKRLHSHKSINQCWLPSLVRCGPDQGSLVYDVLPHPHCLVLMSSPRLHYNEGTHATRSGSQSLELTNISNNGLIIVFRFIPISLHCTLYLFY